MGTSTGAKALSYFVVTVLVERAYGTETLGAFSIALTVGLVALRLADFGVNTIVTRETAKHPDAGGSILRAAARIRAGGLIAVLAATFAGFTIVPNGQRLLVTLLGIYIGLELISKTLFANSQGRQRMVEEAAIAVPTGVLIVAGALWATAATEDVTAVGWAFVVAGVLQLAGALLTVPRRAVGRQGEVADWSKRLMREGWPVGLAALGAFLYYRIDTLMLGWLADLVAVGEYTMGSNLLYAPNLVFWALCGAALPILSSAGSGDRTSFERKYRQLAVGGVVLGAMALLFIPAVGWILRLVYADVPDAAVTALQILLTSQIFSFVAAATGTALIAIGEQRRNVVIAVVATVSNVGLNLAVIPRFAAPGAAATTIATEAIAALCGVLLLQRAGVHLFPRREQSRAR